MTDLTGFITARLDEDEAAAKARRGTFPSPGVEDDGAVWLHIKRGGNAVVVHYRQPVEGYGDMADLKAWADTEQGWTQARALREVEAIRRVLDALGYLLPPGVAGPADPSADDPVLCAIAAIWSDHPEFRPEWSPAHASG